MPHQLLCRSRGGPRRPTARHLHATATAQRRQAAERKAERALARSALAVDREVLAARKVLGWPKRCKLAHAFLWECSGNRLELARLLGRHGVFLTWVSMHWKA